MSFNYDAAVKEIKADYDAWVEKGQKLATQKPTTPEACFKMQKQMQEIQKGMEDASTRLSELNKKVMNIALSIKI